GPALGCRDERVQRKRLARSFRSIYLDDPAAGKAPDAQRDVQRDRPSRDHLDRCPDLVAQPHYGASAELALDLSEGGLQGLVPVAALAARPVDACHGYSRWDKGLPVRADATRRH